MNLADVGTYAGIGLPILGFMFGCVRWAAHVASKATEMTTQLAHIAKFCDDAETKFNTQAALNTNHEARIGKIETSVEHHDRRFEEHGAAITELQGHHRRTTAK